MGRAQPMSYTVSQPIVAQPTVYWTSPQQPAQQAFVSQQFAQQPNAQVGILGSSPTFLPTQQIFLPSAFNTMTIQDTTWNMDTGASSYLNSNVNNLSTIFNSCLYPSVRVGDGKTIPVTNTGHSILPTLHRPLHLHNVLVTPNIIKNLISVCQFTRDNNYTIEFDAFGFSVKDFFTRHILLRCDSLGDLYPVTQPSSLPSALMSLSSSTWHQRLGHPDVKNAFLNGDLSETVYMHQPLGFVDRRYPHHVCRLQRSLYGLKQAPRAWFHRFASYATRVGFSPSRCDSFLFIYRSGTDTAYLLIYVDDIVLTAFSTTLLQKIIFSLHKEFDKTDLGTLNYFLGISVTRDTTGMFLSQKKYAIELLKRAHMLNCNPTRTLVDTESKLGPEGTPILDPTLYRSLAGGLQYLTFTRPDLSYAVQQICLYMHDPREPHLAALKRILRYVQGTLEFGLQLYASSEYSLVAYSDADWAGCPATRRSTSGYCVFLGNNLLSWSSKRQHTLSRSSVEAEYRGVANVHQRTKHIEIDIHFVRDMVSMGHVRVLHVSSRYQYVDIFTKGLPSALFEEFRTSLSVRLPPAQNTGEC
ncbi:ribonuclease H-like domain-containing protein [Tanacetum coccineum]